MERLKLHFMIAVLDLLMDIYSKTYENSNFLSKEMKYAIDVKNDLHKEMNKLL